MSCIESFILNRNPNKKGLTIKKISVERQTTEEISLLGQLMVTVEGSKPSGDEGSTIYELPLDSKWEYPRDLLELGAVLREEGTRITRTAFAHCTIKTDETLCLEGNVEKVTTRGELVITPAAKKPETVTVKMLSDDHKQEDLIDFVKEVEVLKALGRHENIVSLLGICSQPCGQPLLAIVECAEYGRLMDYLESLPTPNIRAIDLVSYGWQVSYLARLLKIAICYRLQEVWSIFIATTAFMET